MMSKYIQSKTMKNGFNLVKMMIKTSVVVAWSSLHFLSQRFWGRRFVGKCLVAVSEVIYTPESSHEVHSY